MKYNPGIEMIMSIAARECISGNYREIEPEHLLIGIFKFAEIDRESLKSSPLWQVLYQESETLGRFLQQQKLEPGPLVMKLRTALGDGGVPFQGKDLHRSLECKRLFLQAEDIAAAARSADVNATHLLAAILDNPPQKFKEIMATPVVKPTPPVSPLQPKNTETSAGVTPLPLDNNLSLGLLTDSLKKLRQQLREIVFGQEDAVYSFVEGLFNAEIAASADEQRRRPKGIFVFAGPPGVGKTYMAETAALNTGKPFKRFDMSTFSSSSDVSSLLGIHKSYKGAHPGLLTEFVKNNPDSLLLFDEIEKAHLDIIHLFLQILDAGVIEDKFLEEKVEFKNTIIIFTTNAGKALYDQGLPTHITYHRKTLLDALQNETDPRTGKPFFPQAICSRMATGYPVMFKHLGIVELVKAAEAELLHTASLFARQYGVPITFSPIVPLLLILKEGVRTDARTIRAQAEIFLKAELFNFAQLYHQEKVDELMTQTAQIHFDLDPSELLAPEVKSLLEPGDSFKILLVAEDYLRELWEKQIPTIEWITAHDIPDVLNTLETQEIDMVLLDLWVNPWRNLPKPTEFVQHTALDFDFTPASARGLAFGQEILSQVHTRRPDVPRFLLSIIRGNEKYREVDEGLFLACARSGGVQGVIKTSFYSTEIPDWETARSHMQTMLENILQRLYRERKALEMGKEQKVLQFDTAPQVNKEEKRIMIRLRNLRLTQAAASGDIAAFLQDVERPATVFADVYGADAAKAELEFIVAYFKNPRQYKTMGLKPPKGILLYGSPGTGKTMLARALAGECQTSFINTAATAFVTIWQGSGPQNVRDMFARARKYAPTIIFIDEIDAIGKTRTGGIGGNEAAEQTLNALLTEMDGFENTSTAKPVIVLAATNLPGALDEALRRRFSREIEVDKPDRTARSAYLKRRLQGTKLRQVSDETMNRIAGQSANMTIAELERIVELAGRLAAKTDGVITDTLIEEAFEKMRLGETRKTAAPDTLLQVARHEAGHCLIGWLNGEKPVQITIVARGKTGGYVERQNDEEKMLLSKPELETRIRQAMAGRAAEILYYGNQDGLTTGVASDLQNASYYAGLMVREYGMDDKTGQVTIDPRHLTDGPLAIAVTKAIEKIIQNQMDLALEELKKNKSFLDLLVEQLMEKNRLTTAELENLLPIV